MSKIAFVFPGQGTQFAGMGKKLYEEVNEETKKSIDEIFSNLENEKDRKRTDKSFFVPKQEIIDNDYDLSINKYKEIVYEKVEYEEPKVILEKLEELSKSIDEKLKELKVMLDEDI